MEISGLSADLRQVLVRIDHVVGNTEALRAGDITVLSKADLRAGPTGQTAGHTVAVSSTTGTGLPELEALLTARVVDALGREEAPVLTRARHRREKNGAPCRHRRAPTKEGRAGEPTRSREPRRGGGDSWAQRHEGVFSDEPLSTSRIPSRALVTIIKTAPPAGKATRQAKNG